MARADPVLVRKVVVRDVRRAVLKPARKVVAEKAARKVAPTPLHAALVAKAVRKLPAASPAVNNARSAQSSKSSFPQTLETQSRTIPGAALFVKADRFHELTPDEKAPL